MTRPDERRFVLFQRGHVRDQIILAHMRNQMRTLVNPDTLAVFTEDEILRLTQPGSRFYIEADAIDLYGQAVQSKNSYFVDQMIPSRASSAMLKGTHGPLWLPEGYLPAVGGSGEVSAEATSGVVFVGSSTIGDPGATWGRDPNGKRYQVLTTRVTPGSGVITDLVLVGIDGGEDTNLAIGTEIEWSNPPIGAQPVATVATAFDGGLEQETDAEFASRVEDTIHHRPASGNQAHFRAWARRGSNQVETAFVYACGLHAGSVVVCVTRKRGSSVGPLARIPTLAMMTVLTGYLVPPNSPVVPGDVHVLLVPPASSPSDIALALGLRKGTNGGWGNLKPWPKSSATYPIVAITAVTDQTHFQITTDVAPGFPLPASGDGAPLLMAWNTASSEFEQLVVTSVTSAGAGVYNVVLLSAPSFTIAIGTAISPFTDRHEVISQAAQDYFDGLGPGEIVNLATDIRAHRAFRYPEVAEEYPQRVGQTIVTTVLESLGNSAGDALLTYASASTPTVPSSITSGPNMMTLGKVGVYNLE